MIGGMRILHNMWMRKLKNHIRGVLPVIEAGVGRTLWETADLGWLEIGAYFKGRENRAKLQVKAQLVSTIPELVSGVCLMQRVPHNGSMPI